MSQKTEGGPRGLASGLQLKQKQCNFTSTKLVVFTRAYAELCGTWAEGRG